MLDDLNQSVAEFLVVDFVCGDQVHVVVRRVIPPLDWATIDHVVPGQQLLHIVNLIMESLHFAASEELAVLAVTNVNRDHSDMVSSDEKLVGVLVENDDTEHSFKLLPKFLDTILFIEHANDFAIRMPLEVVLLL